MAHKKSGGAAKNGRDSHGQRRGVKRYAGERVKAGCILVRQCGTRVHAGVGVRVGKDYTLYATSDGVVSYRRGRKDRNFVSIVAQA